MAAPCYHAQSNIPTISADVTVTPSVDGSRFVVAAPVTTRTITLDTTNAQPGESVSFTVIAVNGTADVIFQDSGATERGLPALIEGRASSNFAMALMLKDVSLATQLGMNCGAPMLMHNIARGLLQTGVYECEDGANTDEVRKVIEAMADVKFQE